LQGLTKATLTFDAGTVIALYTVGGIFGSLSNIWLGDLLGRRRIIFYQTGVAVIGSLLMATSYDLPQFIVARIVLGVGTGGYLATVPVWQSELSKPNKRGAHVVADGIYVGIGTSLALWIDFGLFFVKNSSVSWRFPLAFQIVISLIVMTFIFTLPESPRWLMKKGREQESREIIGALLDVEPDSEQVNSDISDIQHTLAISGEASWGDMLKMGEQRLFHRTILAAAGQMFQQMCGVNLITFYATTIFQQYLKMNAVNSRILSAAMTLTQPFGGLFAFFTIERLGRRALMLYSAAVMGGCMAILAGTNSAAGNSAAMVVAVVFMFIFQFTFTVGYAGLTYLYAAEIAPLQLRAAISAVSTAAVWTFNFLLAEVTPVGFDTIKYRYYIIFAVINACIVPTIHFFYPETKGRTLEEIDEIFIRSNNILDPPRIARSMPKQQTHEVRDAEVKAEEATSDDGIKDAKD
jgi:sugar porter (SP) family MFS transporter